MAIRHALLNAIMGSCMLNVHDDPGSSRPQRASNRQVAVRTPGLSTIEGRDHVVGRCNSLTRCSPTAARRPRFAGQVDREAAGQGRREICIRLDSVARAVMTFRRRYRLWLNE